MRANMYPFLFEMIRYRRYYATSTCLLETVVYAINTCIPYRRNNAFAKKKNPLLITDHEPQPSYAVQGYHNQ
jgi:hypothetical protein